MKKLILLLIPILTSCNSFKNTPNEDKGIQEILNLLGGQCKYSVGFNSSTKNGTEKYYQIEISNSDAIEKYATIIEMPASLAAYTFYKNLAEEKSNYTNIKITTLLKDGQQNDFTFKTEDLETVSKNIPKVESLIPLMNTKNFEEINKLFIDSTLVAVDTGKLKLMINQSDSLYGPIKTFSFYGFRFFEKSGIKMLHLSGALNREKQGIQFSVDMNPDKDAVFYYLKEAF